MPHVKERRPEDDDVQPQDRTDGPHRDPSGALGGEPINADETAPRDTVPGPADDAGTTRHPEAVDEEPGSDL